MPGSIPPLDPLPVPNLPVPVSRAEEFVREVRLHWNRARNAKHAQYELEMLVISPLGQFRVARLYNSGSNMIVAIVDAPGEDDFAQLCLPPEQCSIMIQHFKPTPEKPKREIGFAPQA